MTSREALEIVKDYDEHLYFVRESYRARYDEAIKVLDELVFRMEQLEK